MCTVGAPERQTGNLHDIKMLAFIQHAQFIANMKPELGKEPLVDRVRSWIDRRTSGS